MSKPTPIENTPELWLNKWPWPDRDGHKYKRGALACVTGGPSSTGAARLAARAGLRIGAGLATLFSPPSAVLVNAAHSTSVMVKAFGDADELAEMSAAMDCVLIGPAAGINSATRENVLSVVDNAGSSVLDADALTVFKNDPQPLFDRIKHPCVLTPHDGEFKRIFPDLLDTRSREDAVLSAAATCNATVILKGAETLIASPDGKLAANRHATPFLATAGSGDVLAGIVAGLLSQGMDAFDAACAAAWVHGEAGRRLGPGMISEDLPEELPAIQSDFYASRP